MTDSQTPLAKALAAKMASPEEIDEGQRQHRSKAALDDNAMRAHMGLGPRQRTSREGAEQ